MKFDAPFVDLRDARVCFEEMRKAENHFQFDRAWVHLLTALTRAWHRTQACLKPFPELAHLPSVVAAREHIGDGGDELLVYLRMARNVRDHGLSDLTAREGRRLEIRPASGGRGFLARDLTIVDGRVVSLDAADPVVVAFTPARIVASTLVVEDKVGGVMKRYPPPMKHFGREIEGTEIFVLAELGIDYYDRLVREIEAQAENAVTGAKNPAQPVKT